ncbi:hypothetical protein roselon_01354 [Roseibacterium elongatum DSM 19469]|uniref:Type I phosphodiesterase/nucleotide pyrophosphatase n=2 Tax=Roseicyclus elongatus TaxID=159346 RepID=W8S0Q8_9RHOB|nr:hypothetical protein roselon_01354 [Roseibacterium elongatum DSM 19469]
MKLLVVGIDGGTADVFDAFDMPFWASLRKSDVTFDVTEDLNQRGWARMLSGKGAEETGGLYMRPAMDASRKFSISYGYKDLAKTPGFTPIWKLAEAAGARVGMMNVPTTSPAQPVNGFYISGGGGGIMQGGLPENAAYPPELAQQLNDLGYVFDTRLGAQSFKTHQQLFERLDSMLDARARCFSEIALQQQIDFGFLTFRAPTVLMYLAMSEIAHIMRLPLDHPDRRAWSSPWLALVNRHMKAMDDALARLFDRLQPEHHIVASDHSMVPWTHNVDFNGFLTQSGFARAAGSAKTLLRNGARAALRPKFRKQLGQVPVSRLAQTMRTANAGLAGAPRAFSGTYVYGIYVNDGDRFGGPVPGADVTGETDAIIDAFNWEAMRNGIDMRAAPYRRTFGDAPQEAILPDITILQSGHAFPSATVGGWYARNPNFGPVRSVQGVGGMHSGQKGRHPMLMADPALAALHDGAEAPDLRLVHRLTKRLFAGDDG